MPRRSPTSRERAAWRQPRGSSDDGLCRVACPGPVLNVPSETTSDSRSAMPTAERQYAAGRRRYRFEPWVCLPDRRTRKWTSRRLESRSIEPVRAARVSREPPRSRISSRKTMLPRRVERLQKRSRAAEQSSWPVPSVDVASIRRARGGFNEHRDLRQGVVLDCADTGRDHFSKASRTKLALRSSDACELVVTRDQAPQTSLADQRTTSVAVTPMFFRYEGGAETCSQMARATCRDRRSCPDQARNQ